MCACTKSGPGFLMLYGMGPTEEEFVVLKRLKDNHRYSVAISQVMIINLLPFLNCSAQLKILNYNYIYYTNFNTH